LELEQDFSCNFSTTEVLAMSVISVALVLTVVKIAFGCFVLN